MSRTPKVVARFALWLATVTDGWARRLNDDGTAAGLADALEVWRVDRGTLAPRTDSEWREVMVRNNAFGAPPTMKTQRRQAMERHPAKGVRR